MSEHLSRKILSVVLLGTLGFTACGDKNEKTHESAIADINRMQKEMDRAVEDIDAYTAEFNSYSASLPPDCLKAIKPFLPGHPYAKLDKKAALAGTSEWCGPDHLSAVNDLRNMQTRIIGARHTADHDSVSIAANLAYLGIRPQQP